MKKLDIAYIIKTSNSSFLKRLPGFFIIIIAKIFRENEMNRILDKYSAYNGVDFLPKIMEELDIKVNIEGLENFPEKGKCIFVANHPFGLLDGLILTNMVAQKYGDLRAIGNNAFMWVPNLHPIVAQVNVFDKNSRKDILELENIFHSDIPITHFPFGLVSRIYQWKIQDKYWKKSFVTKAISSQRTIVPIRFYGRNSRLFYFIFILRKIFRINMTIELLLLPRELFWKKGKTIKVKVHKPIYYQDLKKGQSHWDLAQKIKKEVYA